MKRDAAVTIELPMLRPNSGRVAAIGRTAYSALVAIDSPKMWDHAARAWLFPRNRVDDLVAQLSRNGRAVYVIEVDQ
jgi:hypothetical protein